MELRAREGPGHESPAHVSWGAIDVPRKSSEAKPARADHVVEDVDVNVVKLRSKACLGVVPSGWLPGNGRADD